jgi:hypothetical protein
MTRSEFLIQFLLCDALSEPFGNLCFSDSCGSNRKPDRHVLSGYPIWLAAIVSGLRVRSSLSCKGFSDNRVVPIRLECGPFNRRQMVARRFLNVV